MIEDTTVIGGGRAATTAERFALTDIERLEAKWNGLVDRVKGIPGIDMRQVAIAVTEAEGAYMRLVRAITRPARLVETPFADLAADLRDSAHASEEAA